MVDSDPNSPLNRYRRGEDPKDDGKEILAGLGSLMRDLASVMVGFAGRAAISPTGSTASVQPNKAATPNGGPQGGPGQGQESANSQGQHGLLQAVTRVFRESRLVHAVAEMFKRAGDQASKGQPGKGAADGTGGSSSFAKSLRSLILGRRAGEGGKDDRGSQGIAGVLQNLNPFQGTGKRIRDTHREITEKIRAGAAAVNRNFNPFHSGEMPKASGAAIRQSPFDTSKLSGAGGGSGSGSGGGSVFRPIGGANVFKGGTTFGAAPAQMAGRAAISPAAQGLGTFVGAGAGGAAGGAAAGVGLEAGEAAIVAIGAAAATVATPLLLVAGVAATLTGALSATAYGAKAFGDSVLSSRQYLTMFNGQIAGVFAQLQAQQIQLGYRTAGATQNSTAELGRAMMELNEAVQPLTETGMRVVNAAATIAARIGTMAATILDVAQNILFIKQVAALWSGDKDLKENTLSDPKEFVRRLRLGQFIDSKPRKPIQPL